LKGRKYYSNYAFHDSSATLVIYVKKVNEKTMRICFNSKNDCIEEKYEKNL
jgi:hypothetical protein